MGIIKQGILGGFSNKVGTVIGSSWKGIAVMRSMPQSVANPRTASQVANRSKFGQVTKLGVQILSSVIQPNFNAQAKRMSGYNLWCKINRDLYETKTAVQMAGAVVVSKGDLGNSSIQINYDPSNNYFTLSWDKDVKNPKDTNGDLLEVVGLEIPSNATTLDQAVIKKLPIPRITRDNGLSDDIAFVPEAGKLAFAIAYFKSANGKEFSDSVVLPIVMS